MNLINKLLINPIRRFARRSAGGAAASANSEVGASRPQCGRAGLAGGRITLMAVLGLMLSLMCETRGDAGLFELNVEKGTYEWTSTSKTWYDVIRGSDKKYTATELGLYPTNNATVYINLHLQSAKGEVTGDRIVNLPDENASAKAIMSMVIYENEKYNTTFCNGYINWSNTGGRLIWVKNDGRATFCDAIMNFGTATQKNRNIYIGTNSVVTLDGCTIDNTPNLNFGYPSPNYGGITTVNFANSSSLPFGAVYSEVAGYAGLRCFNITNANISFSAVQSENGSTSADFLDKIAWSVRLGANNTSATPAVTVSGQYVIVSGSTLAIDASEMTAGTYSILQAGTFTNPANLALTTLKLPDGNTVDFADATAATCVSGVMGAWRYAISAASNGSAITLTIAKAARYSTDGGSTWTYTDDVKTALNAVKGSSGGTKQSAIVEFSVDGAMTEGSATEIYNDVILRTWPLSAGGTSTRCKLYRGDTSSGTQLEVENGATLTVTNAEVSAGSSYIAGLIKVVAGGTLRLEEGALLSTSMSSGAGQAVITSGTLIFDGGIISGWNVSVNGTVKYGADTGRVYLYGGGVENCTNASSGDTSASAICGEDRTFSGVTEPVFVMTGGFIRNNHCSNTSGKAGAIGFRAGATAIISISGGAITNNTGASADFTGVRLCNSNAKLNISGNPIIADNYASSTGTKVLKNIDLTQSDPQLIQTDNLTEGANVGVYSSHYTTEDPIFGSLATAGYTGAKYIHNDRDALLAGKADGTNLKWASVIEAPAIEAVTAKQTAAGTATLTLTNITIGTGSTGTEATSYAVWCSVDDGTAVEKLTGQTATDSVSFTCAGLSVADHSFSVYIVNDQSVSSAAVSASLTVKTVTEPSVGSASAEQTGGSGGKGTVTVTLSDIVRGTGDDGVAATKHKIYYVVSNATTQVKLGSTNLGTATSCSISSLDPGTYTCTTWIYTNKSKTSNKVQTDAFTVLGVTDPAFSITSVTQTGDGTAQAAINITTLGTDTVGVPAEVCTVSWKVGDGSYTELEGAYGTGTHTFPMTGLDVGENQTLTVTILTSPASKALSKTKTFTILDVRLPSFALVNPASVSGQTATIAVDGTIDLGTSDVGVPATTYSAFYKLDAATDFTETSTLPFTLANQAIGEHTCLVYVTNTFGRASATVSTAFTVKQKYTVTFNPDNGDATTSVEVEDGDPVAAPSPAPTKTGYILAGWFKGSDAWDFSTPVTESMTLKAKWSPEPQDKVRYSADGETWAWAASVDAAYAALVADMTTAKGYIEVCEDQTFMASASLTFATNIVLQSYSAAGATTRYTLTRGSENYHAIVSDGCTLKIANLKVDGKKMSYASACLFEVAGTLEMATGSLITTSSSASSEAYAVNLNAATSQLEFTGGYIDGWKSTTSRKGAVKASASGARVTMSAGGIRNCSIASNANSADGSAVVLADGTTFEMSGGEITGCSGLNGFGAAVYLAEGATMTMTGGEISGNTVGTVAAESSNVYGAGIYVYAKLNNEKTACTGQGLLNISGAAVVSNNTITVGDAALACNVGTIWKECIKLDGSLTAGAYVGVNYPYGSKLKSGAQFAVASLDDNGGKRAGAEFFHADRNAELSGVNTGTTLIWSTDAKSAPVRFSYDEISWCGATDVASALNAMAQDGVVEVNEALDDVFVFSEQVTLTHNVTLRSNKENGRLLRIKRTCASTFTNPGVEVPSGCTLTIEDLEIDANFPATYNSSTGKWHLMFGVHGTLNLNDGCTLLDTGDVAVTADMVAIQDGGTLNINGGYITGWKGSGYNCAAVDVSDQKTGNVNITAGGITNCTVCYDEADMGCGCAIFYKTGSTGTVNISGSAVIKDNETRGASCAPIYSIGNNVFNITGGEISGNRCGSSRAAVYVGSSAQLNFSGSPVIAGNTQYGDATTIRNVGSLATSQVRQTGDLAATAEIGVCGHNSSGATFGTWVSGSGANRFSCDEQPTWSGKVDGGSLVWMIDPSKSAVRYSTDAGETWAGADSLPAAATGLGASDGIVEINRNLTNATAVAFTGSVTLRSNSERADLATPYTLTCESAGTFDVATGKALTVGDLGIRTETTLSDKLFDVTGTLVLTNGATVACDGAMTQPAVNLNAGSTLTIHGGVIDGWQYATSGTAAIVNTGAATINLEDGGVINCAGGVAPVYLSSGATLNLTGGVVTNNVSSGFVSAGGAIFADNGAKVNVSGSPCVYGNTAGGAACDIVPAAATLVEQTGDLADAAKVGVNYPLPLADSSFGTAASAYEGAEAFVCDSSDSLTGEIEDDKLVWNFRAEVPVRYRTSADGATWGEWTDTASVVEAVTAINGADGVTHGEVEILGNQTLALASDLTVAKAVTLRSNSSGTTVYTLTRTSTSDAGHTVFCGSGSAGSLTLANIRIDGNAGQNVAPLFSVATAFTLGAEAVIYSSSAGAAPAVKLTTAGAQATIAGGYIDGWRSLGAAAVWADAAGTVTITSGGIVNCTDSNASTASALYLGASGAAFAFTGGEITGNAASGSNPAVRIASGATMSVSGTPVLRGNGSANLALASEAQLTQTGDLGAEASLYVNYPESSPQAGVAFGVYSAGLGSDSFHCDGDALLCGATSGGQLVWASDTTAHNVRYRADGSGSWIGANDLAAAAAALPAGGFIEANRDYTDSSAPTFAGTVTIRSNSDKATDFTITRGTGLTWTVPNGATVTVTEVTINGGAQEVDLFTVETGGSLTFGDGAVVTSRAE